MPAEYDIRHYRPDDLPQVVRLQRHLWGEDLDANRAYFKWKYVQNPYTERPLGVVAEHRGKVVGFRGFTATLWHIPGSDRKLRVLGSGDSVVHPDHRLKGLFVIMGDFAASEYESTHDVFLNTTASKNSAPGYFKTGFAPLLTKTYLMRYNTIHLSIHYIMDRFKKAITENKLEHTEYDRFVVSPYPLTEAMNSAVSIEKCDPVKLTLLKNPNFFEWKYNNKRDDYHYYYYKESDAIRGYMVIRAFGRLRRGVIYDYAVAEERILEHLLRFIVKSKRYYVLMILEGSLGDGLKRLFRRMKFTSNSLFGKIEKQVKGEWPIFIRPIKARPREEDWFVRGLDIRRIEHWDIKEVCSD
jgi:hypothetical protein